jgi:hypothetical protein
VKLVFMDFESMYDTDYSLSKMTTAEYIRDERFEAIGYSIRVADGPTTWHTGDARTLRQSLGTQAWWDDAIMVSHNAFFDALVLGWRFGLQPAKLLCTLSMARALGLDHTAGGSLAALARLMRSLGHAIPEKGDEVVRALGKRRADFTPDELARYGAYCCTDTDICAGLFAIMAPLLAPGELAWHDIAVRMAACPMLTLNRRVLEADLTRVRKRKAELNATLAKRLGVQSDIQLQAALGSNNRFALMLELQGGAMPWEWFADDGDYTVYLRARLARTGGAPVHFEIPVKPSPANPSELTHAFAKDDEGLLELAESGDTLIEALVAARLGVKSTIEETRLEKLIGLSKYPTLSVPVKVSGAHTHRLGGDDGINLQNLPSGRIDGQSAAMRHAIEAPEGYVLVAGDSRQVECRTLAYQANQRDLLRLFAQGGDPYPVMAAQISGLDAEEIRTRAKRGLPEDLPYVTWRQTGKATELGAGFGMGWQRFRKMARAQHGVVLEPQMAQHAIDVYRQSRDRIVLYWRRCEDVLRDMIAGGSGWFGGPRGTLFWYEGNRVLFGVHTPGVQLPDGMWLNYPKLRVELVEDRDAGRFNEEIVYERRRGRSTMRKKIYGAKLAENLTQALAFAIMKWQARRIARRYSILLNEHDAWVAAVRENQVDEARAYFTSCMREVPAWVEGLPLDCEVGAAKSFGGV